MKRLSISLSLIFLSMLLVQAKVDRKAAKDREFWVATMEKICTPVLKNLSEGTLRQNMPVETYAKDPETKREVAHLEAFGRVMTGIGPWLELGPDDTKEGKLRAEFINMTILALKNAVDPDSADFLNFNKGSQPLVDAAFLAHGLLRCRTQVWDNLDSQTQERVIEAFKSSRVIKPHENNWLLFAAMVECALKEFSGEWDYSKVEYALNKHEEWYKGDGVYGDGPNFHFDYYNSFVIQPMMTQVLEIVCKYIPEKSANLKKQQKRYTRYAEQQERMISPEGTFPAVGRSLAYRFGAFYALSDVSYRQMLPKKISPAQVRSGLTTVIKRQVSMPGTFDKNGWLQLGFAGHQPSIAERYINTGSSYLCSAVFVALGLPADSEFWSAPAQDWTQKKVWNGVDVPCDKAYKEKKVVKKSMEEITDFVFERAASQFALLDVNVDSVAALKPGRAVYPRSIKPDGSLMTSNYKWWCSGFYPGSLWYVYEYTKDDRFKEMALKYQAGLEPLRFRKDDHDIGFQLMCSYGNCLRITGDESCKAVLIDGATSLATRFDPEVGCTRSWDNKKYTFPVIIDNMMNLELLLKAVELGGPEYLKDVALAHARTTMKNHFRENNSCYHLVDYNPETGEIIRKQTVQGYADESSWARGQAWALYSYPMMYRFTGEQEFLDHAIAVAEYILPRLPEDGVPYWDFDAPDIPNDVRDASSAALMACALIELSEWIDAEKSTRYLLVAEKMIRSLASKKYLCAEGEDYGFLLKHSTGNKNKNSEVDVPLTYADYYFLEALTRWNLRKHR